MGRRAGRSCVRGAGLNGAELGVIRIRISRASAIDHDPGIERGTRRWLPLLAPGPFATLFGLAGADGWVFRLAGAGCLGYATAGIASLLAPAYRLMRIQNMAAITFNALGAVSAWVAVTGGDGGWLAPVVAAAAPALPSR